MAEQSFKNHTRIDPAYHFVLTPLLLANLVFSIDHYSHQPSSTTGWQIAIAIALQLIAFLMRTYSLRVQDRVIRLEERIRMAALLPLESRNLQRELTTGQIIALRFASDAELASLAEKAVQQRLSPKQIKQQIVDWRPDNHRV